VDASRNVQHTNRQVSATPGDGKLNVAFAPAQWKIVAETLSTVLGADNILTRTIEKAIENVE
jgi:hypothetical protein